MKSRDTEVFQILTFFFYFVALHSRKMIKMYLTANAFRFYSQKLHQGCETT